MCVCVCVCVRVRRGCRQFRGPNQRSSQPPDRSPRWSSLSPKAWAPGPRPPPPRSSPPRSSMASRARLRSDTNSSYHMLVSLFCAVFFYSNNPKLWSFSRVTHLFLIVTTGWWGHHGTVHTQSVYSYDLLQVVNVEKSHEKRSDGFSFLLWVLHSVINLMTAALFSIETDIWSFQSLNRREKSPILWAVKCIIPTFVLPPFTSSRQTEICPKYKLWVRQASVCLSGYFKPAVN